MVLKVLEFFLDMVVISRHIFSNGVNSDAAGEMGTVAYATWCRPLEKAFGTGNKTCMSEQRNLWGIVIPVTMSSRYNCGHWTLTAQDRGLAMMQNRLDFFVFCCTFIVRQLSIQKSMIRSTLWEKQQPFKPVLIPR
jgi:hypothetical protein